MPSQGPRFPATGATLANAGTSENAEAWVSPGNIVSDNATDASITAATYDSPDISQLLIGSNFGFTIPLDAGIVGIVVELERNNAAGAASDNRVQLAKGTTFADLVGSNKADTALDWPAGMTVASYGSSSDLWGATWKPEEINASSFAVFMSVQADAANTDVAVDFYRVTVHYVEPTQIQRHRGDTFTFPPGRLMPRQLVVETRGEPVGEPVIEVVSPGGATAAGVSPIAVVAAVIAGAIGGGAGPSAEAVAGQGGSPATGFAPTPAAAVDPGGASGTGTAASALVPVTPGGATAGGVSPIVPLFETPTPGGATAGGVAPSALVPSGVGSSIGGGAGPSAAAVAGQGGSPASGFAVSSGATVTPGGATGVGSTASALVGVTPGGATAGGNAPSAPLIETPTPGGATAGGNAPLSAASVNSGGAVAVSLSPSARVPVTPAGAIAGGRAPGEFLPSAVVHLDYYDHSKPRGSLTSSPHQAGFDTPRPSGEMNLLPESWSFSSESYGDDEFGL